MFAGARRARFGTETRWRGSRIGPGRPAKDPDLVESQSIGSARSQPLSSRPPPLLTRRCVGRRTSAESLPLYQTLAESRDWARPHSLAGPPIDTNEQPERDSPNLNLLRWTAVNTQTVACPPLPALSALACQSRPCHPVL